MKTDHWFYGLFQSAPDLIALLLPSVGAAGASAVPSLGPDSPGDALYRFEAPEIKAANHRLDGALWPRGSESGTPEHPVVLLEVQMQVLEVVVVVPHRRLRLGPDRLPRQLEAFLAGVHWLSLEELGQQPGLDPLLSLLTLPVLPNPEIPGATEQILQPRPDLLETVLSILGERFPHLTRKEIMALINLPTDHLRHTRWAQEWIEEGRQEGEARGRAAEAAAMAIRQLNHRCGPLSAATTARIQALPLQQLESLSDALLDFAGANDLASWLAEHAG